MKHLLPFKKGDIVYVDSDHCYINYSKFIKRHWKYMLRWAYKCQPDEDRKYKILGIYKHVEDNKYDKNKYIVVVESIVNKQIFLIGELGIKNTFVRTNNNDVEE